MSRFSFICLLLLAFNSNSQLLIINEVSQGTGSKEYVEFVVAGTPTCQVPVPCADLRGVVLDDNNGYFAAGGGNGIAPGAIRFANTSFWSCIPQGTIIVIYNGADVNPALPPDDLTMNDNNCKLVIPINSTLIEGQGISTTSSITTYPSAASWVAGGGNWNQVSMNNSDDSFLTTPNIGTTTPTHGVSWGSNSDNAIIYFSGSASNKVFYFANSFDNNPSQQNNWISGNVGSDETPGIANNPANASWISSMNPQCGIGTSMQLALSAVPTNCGGTCIGSANVQVTGGVAPYNFSWSNGANTQAIDNLCAGTYTVEVTDAGGCTATDQVLVANAGSNLNVQLVATNESCENACDGEISAQVSGGTQPYTYLWNTNQTSSSLQAICPGNYDVVVTDQAGCSGIANTSVLAGVSMPDATITAHGPFESTDAPFQFTANSASGSWSSNCGACITQGGIFDPQVAGPGTYQICFEATNGGCTDQDCISVTVTGCSPETTTETQTICPGTSIDYNGQTISTAGSYPFIFQNQEGCDSTHILNLSFFQTNPINQTYSSCEGDSIEVNGIWYMEPDLLYWLDIDGNGCSVQNSIALTFTNCTIEEFSIFIPNTFTPNNDHVNDVFTIVLNGGILKEGYILNRWGNVVKEFNSTDMEWNGTTQNGLPVEDGVYTYVVRIEKTGSNNEDFHGFVTVIR